MNDEDLIIKFAALGTSYTQRQTQASDRHGKTFDVDYNTTIKLLKRELLHLQARGPVVIQIAIDPRFFRADETGLKSDAPTPAFPGIRLTINSNTRGTLSYQCDAYRNWRENLRAIVLTLERLRLVERDGVANDGQQYRGWRALPAPEHADISTIDAAAAFIAVKAKPQVAVTSAAIRSDAAVANRAYRAAAMNLHADRYKHADQAEQWNRLQAAWGLIEPMHSASK